MRLLIDECLLVDLAGDNGIGRQKAAILALEWIVVSRQRLCVVNDSPWSKKAYALMRSTDLTVRHASKYLQTKILYDSDIADIINMNELRYDFGAADTCPVDDRYLVAAYVQLKAEYFVTSDMRLVERLGGSGIIFWHRDDFPHLPPG